MANSGALLLGGRTYEDFYSYWPKQTGNPFTPVLDNSAAPHTHASPIPVIGGKPTPVTRSKEATR